VNYGNNSKEYAEYRAYPPYKGDRSGYQILAFRSGRMSCFEKNSKIWKQSYFNLVYFCRKYKQLTNSYYIQNINKVIDYIEDHISQKISLEELADIAAFSKYHFHRVFKIVSGETLNKYIKRIKMEKAYKLIQLDKSTNIKDVSILLGYNSTANFSRDFCDYYGVAPTKVQSSHINPNKRANCNDINLDIKFIGIQTIPDKYVIYKRISTGYDPQMISTVFSELYQFALKNNLLQSISQFIGTGYDDPDYTPAEKCRYDACISINRIDKLPGNNSYNKKVLKGGWCAVFSFKGEKNQFHTAWDIIFREWLLSSDYLPDNRPHFEMYLHSKEYEKGIFEANLCLPIKSI